MTNDELNYYIKHYIEKDKTGKSSADWGKRETEIGLMIADDDGIYFD